MPQSLKNQLREYFPERIRQRGDQYYWQRRVRLEKIDDRSVEALVQGSQRYRVSLVLTGSKVFARCTCPYAVDGFADCKHVWAVILSVSDRGLWAERTGLSPDYGNDWDSPGAEAASGSLPSEPPPPPPSSPAPASLPSRNAKRPLWREALHWGLASPQAKGLPPESEEAVLYLVGPDPASSQGGLLLKLLRSFVKRDGVWSKPTPLKLGDHAWPPQATDGDREIFGLLRGFRPAANGSYYYSQYAYQNPESSQYRLSPAAARRLLPLACATGRCLLESRLSGEGSEAALQWDGDVPWRLRLSLDAAGKKEEGFRLTGRLERGDARLDLDQVRPFGGTGLVLAGDKVLSLADVREEDWARQLGSWGHLAVPKAEVDEFLAGYFNRAPGVPGLDLPEGLQPRRKKTKPKPVLRISPSHEKGDALLAAELSFDYEGLRVRAESPAAALYQAKARVLWERDREAEGEAALKLPPLGFEWRAAAGGGASWRLPAELLAGVVEALMAEGWQVEAQGKPFRGGAVLAARVVSGTDWFDLKIGARFDGVAAPVDELLEALRLGRRTVRLDDGTQGLIPAEWLAKWGLVSRMGQWERTGLRFKENQAGLLDALLSAQPEVAVDKAFQAARKKLRQFEGVKPVKPAGRFKGVLRPYQKEGLGWLQFLERFGFGGCLADDMGLGKTVQVLAMLEGRRKEGRKGKRAKGGKATSSGRATSLAVVPKSLIFNWKQEAAKFTPQLKVLDHTGAFRGKEGKAFSKYDLVLTTYGTMRRDISWLSGQPFDYVILDEAHAIKNPHSESAKAARLLKARHRLAMTGTPVQNNLEELWSLFEFLNPGLLGTSRALERAAGPLAHEKEDKELLARAVKPFFLRRTKETVAKDLPPKTEQVLYCDMEGPQKALYDGLKKRYRDDLMRKVAKEGLNRAKMHVLEALLRLRQAACHPGLLEPAKEHEPGAKLEMLVPQLQEVLSEGHKALVFSQFTTFLGILRRRVSLLNIPHAYLDGQSRDREEQVRRFQTDPKCGLFLISLKAGGLGLNLTAAEYVYLLDPWWNPAIEAQAVDRAHRIGQARKVFAYRLITRGTVEEKILEMQAKKRQLVKAVFGAEQGFLKDLKREELEWLLA